MVAREALTDATTSNNIIGVDRVMDMAREFPHVYFRGIDIGNIACVIAYRLNKHYSNTNLILVPIATRYPLPNVQFEIQDVNRNYRWPNETFDLIHARSVSMAVSDPPTMV